ncbi:uncharacterized protein C4orf54 homolog [Rhinatrema bivittatum]|uniref:uncharacterized protein C4orf54 homolog n=1 Tax=Rhinatrema bivittatum TaxID=194408 RepID=UPI001126748A|nr:uncharacterized protein C4orf54 homolog [Rhinatrema bivittatum]
MKRMLAQTQLKASARPSQEGTHVEIHDSTRGAGNSPQTIKLSFAGSQVAFVRPKQGAGGPGVSGNRNPLHPASTAHRKDCCQMRACHEAGGDLQPATSGDESGESPLDPDGATAATADCDSPPGRRRGRPAGGGGEEPFYITTHEIQLCEVDHQLDDDDSMGPAASRWQFEEDNVIYSLVDYASFGSEEGTLTEEDSDDSQESDSSCCSPATTISGGERPPASESTDLVSSSSTTNTTTSSASETDTPGTGSQRAEGQSQQSIKAAPRAINEPNETVGKKNMIVAAAKRGKEATSQLAGRVKQQPLTTSHPQHELAKHIALPGRLQTRGWGAPAEASSGASSAVSELDEADKEVQSLTARAFHSLAYPYFEAINFSSSASSSTVSLPEQRCCSTATLLDCKARGAQPKESISDEQRSIRASVFKQEPRGNQHCQLPVDKTIGSQACAGAAETFTGFPNPPGNAAASSICRDEISESGMPRELGASAGEQSCQVAEAMEGVQKKSHLASTLLKNVISKKIQLEQEFKMERGEITEAIQQRHSDSAPVKELDGPLGVFQRQGSHYHEGGSDCTVVAVDKIKQLFEEKASPSWDCSRQNGSADARLPSLEATVSDGQLSTAEGLLQSSQHSAFRSWHQKELQRLDQSQQKEKKVARDKDQRADLGEVSVGRSTKMSRLFMPSIQQQMPFNKQSEKQVTKDSATSALYTHQTCFSHGGDHGKEPPAAHVTTQTPEIQVTSRMAESKDQPFSIAKLLTPNLAWAAEDRGRLVMPLPPKGEEKLPQFLVRDVRESKPKSLGTLHQVRDVRKLIKSSHLGGSSGGSGGSSVCPSQAKSKLVLSNVPASLSPLVITCQAVNNKEEKTGADKPHPSPLLDTVLVHRTSGRLPVATIAPSKTNPRLPVVKIVSKAANWKMDKPKDEEPKEEPSALQKLTAAVKSMEQLYTFEQHKWRRKDELLGPVTDSHVLSALVSQEQEDEEEEEGEIRVPHCQRSAPNTARFHQTKAVAPGLAFHEVGEQSRRRALRTPGTESNGPGKSLVTLSGAQNLPEITCNFPPPPSSPVTTAKLHTTRTSKATHPPGLEEGGGKKGSRTEQAGLHPLTSKHQPGVIDYGNYLTVLAKGAGGSSNTTSGAEGPALPATAYPPLLFSPPLLPAAAPDQQRKLMLDLSTGQYYVLEVPKHRLYEPEGGRRLEVPGQPIATLPISPLALSPAYMLYPGFLPTGGPLLPTSSLFSDSGSEVPEAGSPYLQAMGKATASSPKDQKPGVSMAAPPQGPQIVAAPSFDGTTMRFIVEHR